MNVVQMEQIRQVNARWNAVPYDALPGPDEGFDWWTDDPAAPGSFVCRDYVVAKAKELRLAGIPPTALTVILCTDELGESHAVLGVQLPGDAETTILDNRYAEPYPMSVPPYAYIWNRRQIAGTTDFTAIA